MAVWVLVRCTVKIAAVVQLRCRSVTGKLLLPAFCSYGTTTVPKIAAKHPFKVTLEAEKKYSWCSCGLSEKQPFCDGSHKKCAPGFVPVRFIADESKTVLLCGCKQTKTPPYCDGTHKEEFVQKQ